MNLGSQAITSKLCCISKSKLSICKASHHGEHAYHNDVGIEFLDIFRNDTNMSAAKVLLERKFVQVSRKDPQGHTNVHYLCWQKFKELIDSVYGGAQNIEIFKLQLQR